MSLLLLGCAWITEAELDDRLDFDDDGTVGAAWGGDDCDDRDPAVTTGRAWYADADRDGYGGGGQTSACAAPEGYVAEGGDCNDGEAGVNPGVTEVWYDGVDQDCDGNDLDRDGDGHPQDCDDTDPAVHPAAVEVWYDGVDQDCSGGSDHDQDADGYELADDCDDTDPTQGGAEVCGNGYDEDCDGLVDDDDPDAELADWYVDVDQDGYGTGAALAACEQPLGYVGNDDDCDDLDADVGPCPTGLGTDDADASFYGDVDDAFLGWSLRGRADLDGDYEPDLLLGAPGTDGYAGAILVVTDPASGAPSATLLGESGSLTGSSVDAGDVTDDGLADVLAGTNSAGVVIAFGHPTDGPFDVSLWPDTGEDANAGAVAFLPDFDADGVGDVLVGGTLGNGGAGGAYILYGPIYEDRALSEADVRFTGAVSGDNAGGELASAGDVDGDGVGDALIAAYGADSDAGHVYLLLGGATGNLVVADVDAVYTGESARDHAGWTLEGPGDVDGDGADDVLIGANQAAADGAYAGRVYLVGAASTGLADASAIVTADAAGGYLGSALSSGDFDGDGRADIAVAAIADVTAPSVDGTAFVFYGPLTGTYACERADVRISSDRYTMALGSALAGVGDRDGDGRDELLLGAWNEDTGGEEAGAAYLFYGSRF